MVRWLRKLVVWIRYKRNKQFYLELDKMEQEWYDDIEYLIRGE